jgi:hypothetical protein
LTPMQRLDERERRLDFGNAEIGCIQSASHVAISVKYRGSSLTWIKATAARARPAID